MGGRQDYRSDEVTLLLLLSEVAMAGGSCAVFLAALLTLSFGSWQFRLLLSVLVTVVEAATLQFDNLFITAVVLAGYVLNIAQI